VAWLPPEPEVGADPELKPLEPELELELDEPEPAEVEPVEPVEPEPAEVEPELAEDESSEPDDSDEPDEVEPVELVVWVDPGRAKARAPAVTTLAMVTAVVVDRTLLRPRSLAAWARRMPSSRRALMSLIMRSRTR
jgi:hypothetical protein